MKYKLQNYVIKFFLLSVIFFMSSSASASGSCNDRPPAEDFVCNVQSKFVICRMKVRLDLLKESSPDITYACIEEDKAKITPLYQSVKNITRKNPEASKSLQNLYSYWLSSMDALKKIKNERPDKYQYRLDKRELGLRLKSDDFLVKSKLNNEEFDSYPPI